MGFELAHTTFIYTLLKVCYNSLREDFVNLWGKKGEQDFRNYYFRKNCF